MNREDNLCWFHGKLSRERAEDILKEVGHDGVFLVRESTTANGDFVLSVLHEGTVVHYQIRRFGEDAFFSIDDQTKIHGLDSLIEHYREAPYGLVTRLSAIVKSDPPPNDSRRHGRTNLLHRATKEGNLIVVSELLKCGYRNIDAKNQDGQTAVHLASKFGSEEILKKLIENGANVNCRDTDGNTPLHYACRNPKMSIVRMLIEAKANIQARNNGTGCVPLHDAANEGNLEVVKELLSLNAPHMPRSRYGEFPADFARARGHNNIAEYLEKYQPRVATTFQYQWYHGTLDRNEAIQLLREHVQLMIQKTSSSGASGTTLEDGGDDEVNFASGVFLVRYSDRNGGSYVLTLLYEDQPKNFIIQKSMNYLFIDEGPYMNSLEHLIQHYMMFSDGLPINLKYPVTPKPKPPIPLFSTIPKKKRYAHSVSSPSSSNNLCEIVSPGEQAAFVSASAQRNRTFSDEVNANLDIITADTSSSTHASKRNHSIPNEAMINKQGIWDTSPPPKDPSKQKDSKGDLLNFRSLKKPKRNIIIDGMKSLKKNKSPNKTAAKELLKSQQQDSVERFERVQKLMQNLSFSTDFLDNQSLSSTLVGPGTTTVGSGDASINMPPNVVNPNDFYNVPKNNCAIVDIDIDGLPVQPPPIPTTNAPTLLKDAEGNNEMTVTNTSNKDYYIESDKNIYGFDDMRDKDGENIYFVEAPMIPKPSTNINAMDQPPPIPPPPIQQHPTGANNNFIFNASGYVISKDVIMFVDNQNEGGNAAAANQTKVERNKPERLASILSNSSNRSESEFLILNQSTCPEDEIPGVSDGQLTRKPNFFIPKENIILDEVLGEGEFGSVWKGRLEMSSSMENRISIPVAIKTLHDEHCKEDRVEFLREAHIMMQLQHACIVKMIGISKGPPLRIVQELMPLGSMLTFLLTHPEQINPNVELMIWAAQIASGMKYLESQHFVHRDLAARNILLASQHQAKISDFGLSRALGADSNYYQASQGGKWPLKWYAPESCNYGTFSHASDVWSFGVTLWEMYSMGAPPYDDMKGVEVIQLIEKGVRLSKPPLCPDKIYTLLENCWNKTPKCRPTFKQLTEFFSNDMDYHCRLSSSDTV